MQHCGDRDTLRAIACPLKIQSFIRRSATDSSRLFCISASCWSASSTRCLARSCPCSPPGGIADLNRTNGNFALRGLIPLFQGFTKQGAGQLTLRRRPPENLERLGATERENP